MCCLVSMFISNCLRSRHCLWGYTVTINLLNKVYICSLIIYYALHKLFFCHNFHTGILATPYIICAFLFHFIPGHSFFPDLTYPTNAPYIHLVDYSCLLFYLPVYIFLIIIFTSLLFDTVSGEIHKFLMNINLSSHK